METTFEEAFDFDLNFIQQPVQNVMSNNKLRKAILIAKKKTIATDSLIKKYLAKKEIVRQSELLLSSAKDQCKRVCIDYKDTLEKCTNLEKELQTLDQKYKILESNYTQSQTQCEAIKSHANQLQSLIKENELKIDSLRLENKLLADKKKEKECKGNKANDTLLTKENGCKKESKGNHEKERSLLKKENETFLKHILLFKDIIMGKTKLQKEHRLILNKYKKSKQEIEINNETHDDDYSSDETDFFDDVTPPPSNETLLSPYQNHGEKVAQIKVFKDTIDDTCAVNVPNGLPESELDSEDTGRGSSLAFSDSGKYFNSPDHYSGDTQHIDSLQNKINTEKYLDASTNTSCNIEHKATSPLMFDDVALLSDNIGMSTNRNLTPRVCSPEYFITDIPLSTEVVTIREKIKTVDRASSPIPEINTMSTFLDPSKSNCKITIEDLSMDVSLFLDTESVTADKLKMVDCATSPIKAIDRVHVSLSPIIFDECDKLMVVNKNVTETCSSALQFKKIDNGATVVQNSNIPRISSVDLTTNTIVEICQNNTIETKCLEENNSHNIDVNNYDKEIEMIFSSMRLEHRLLTPIPQTPLKLRKAISRANPTIMQDNCTDHKCCNNIIRLKKKHFMLQKKYETMEKVIKNLKSSLQALAVFPLKSMEDEWMDGGSVDECSDNDTEKIEEELYRPSLSKHKCINHHSSVRSSSESTIHHNHARKSFSQDAMEVNDEENVPLSELTYQNAAKRQARKSITYEHNLPDKSTDQIVSIEKRVSPNYHNVTEPTACTRITYEDNCLPDKSPHQILSHEINVSPDIIINNAINVNSERNVSPVRNVLNNTQDGDHYKIKSNKKKKLSKLEKLRHKMLPKSKMSDNAIKSLRKKKSVVATIKKPETDKLLKNKLAYEKACKIMAEVKLRNNKTINNKKNHRYSSENDLNEQENIENIALGNINTIQKLNSDSEDTSIESNGRTTRSQTQNISKISNAKESLEKVDDKVGKDNVKKNMSKSISNPKEKEIKTNNCNMANQKSEHIELKSVNLCDSVRNTRRTTRSQSKLSESEGDASLTYKHNITEPDKICKRRTESKNLDHEEELKEKLNTSIQSNEASVALSSKKQADCSNQEQKNQTTNNTIDLCHAKRKSPVLRKRSRDQCDELIEPIPKRVLRSSRAKESNNENLNTSCDENNSTIGSYIDTNKMNTSKCDKSVEKEIPQNKNQDVIDYGDLNIFTTMKSANCTEKRSIKSTFTYPKNSILCKSIDKYGKKSVRFSTNKVTEQVSNTICTKLEEDIAHITQMPADKVKQGMNKLVDDVQKVPIKTFLTGFIKYLRQPMRKQEMFKLMNTPPAPPMTKSEQILLFVIRRLKQDHSNIVESILENMEYSLFQLNKTPEFDIVESMSHFYAIVCRYFGLKRRLRLFLLDAMYCMSFKAVTVVKNCLDVWMHVLPLAHMGIAKSPLVTCLVYLLHFYKCEDKFMKVDVIRNTLQYKYFYKITEMTETKMLEMFMNAVKQINDVPIEKKILRTALIILSKRRGAVWCQKNIIKNMLLPIIETEKCSNVSKEFAVSMLGPLVKPYPIDMKVHSEIIVNQLMDMVDQNPSDSMKEAIFTSLIFMSRQNHFRVTQALLNWEPESVSREFEEVIKDFVLEKPIKTWTKILPKMLFQQG